jgi:hypothetical protein
MDDQENQLSNLIYEKEIKVFQHCNNEKIICFSLPDKCPVCNVSLDSNSLKVPPFVLASPFLKPQKLPELSLILQPSCGDYTDYLFKKSEIGFLHIGRKKLTCRNKRPIYKEY